MPYLAAFLASALTKLIEFFGRRVTERLAITLGTLTLIAAAWAALYAATTVALAALSLTIPSSLLGPMQLIAPTGFRALLTTWISIEFSLAAYRKVKDSADFGAKIHRYTDL